MSKKEKQSLIRYLVKILLFTILLILISFIIIEIWTEYQSYLDKSDEIKAHIYSKQKLIVKSQVQKAVDIIKLGDILAEDNGENFNQQAILDYLGTIRFGSENDGYIFIVTYNGVTVLNDIKKELVGKNLWDLTDPTGVKIIQEERRAADIPGGGFIQYSWEKPSTGIISPKISYIIGIPEKKWMVGAGIYINEIEDQLIRLKHEMLLNVIFYILIFFAAALIIILFVFLLDKKLIQIIKNDISVFTHFFTYQREPKEFINVENIHFNEFNQIAGSINSMIQVQNDTIKEAAYNKTQFENLFSNIQDVVIITDKNRTIINANQPALSTQLGYDLDEIIGKNALILFNNYTDYTDTGEKFFSIKREHSGSRIFTSTYKKKNGELVPFEILAFQLEDSITGEILTASINRNISERIKFQNSLKDSLIEKDLLLREIHHRVKNNMSIIIAFISIQAIKLEDKKTKSILESTENRIRAMALVHEFLYKDTNIKTINIEEYLQILISDLIINSGKSIKLSKSITNIELDLDTLIPLGLLVNEIVSNAIKHAYDSSIKNPTLEISLKSFKNRIILKIKDNGTGISSLTNYDKNNTTGLVFIKTLTEQINGHLEVTLKNGTEYTITF